MATLDMDKTSPRFLHDEIESEIEQIGEDFHGECAPLVALWKRCRLKRELGSDSEKWKTLKEEESKEKSSQVDLSIL